MLQDEAHWIATDKEPALLEEFVPAFLELEVDKTAEVRKTLVAFLDDVIKQFPQCASMKTLVTHHPNNCHLYRSAAGDAYIYTTL